MYKPPAAYYIVLCIIIMTFCVERQNLKLGNINDTIVAV